MAEAVVTLSDAEVKQAVAQYLSNLGWDVTGITLTVSRGQRDEEYVQAVAKIRSPSPPPSRTP